MGPQPRIPTRSCRDFLFMAFSHARACVPDRPHLRRVGSCSASFTLTSTYDLPWEALAGKTVRKIVMTPRWEQKFSSGIMFFVASQSHLAVLHSIAINAPVRTGIILPNISRSETAAFLAITL